MIKPQELRIGNYYIDIDDSLCELSAYELYQFRVKLNNDNLGVSEYRPIPITEDWLLKLGFEYNTKDWLEYKWKNLLFNSDTSVNFEIVFLNATNDWIEVKYIHQLQNLFFALTGEELKIKELENLQQKQQITNNS